MQILKARLVKYRKFLFTFLDIFHYTKCDQDYVLSLFDFVLQNYSTFAILLFLLLLSTQSLKVILLNDDIYKL